MPKVDFFKRNKTEDGRARIQVKVGETLISVVELPLYARFRGNIEMLLFDGPYDGQMWRYETWESASIDLGKVIDALMKGENPSLAIGEGL